MPSNLRRLATDHAALQGDSLPPYYLFPPEDGRFYAIDDLTQVNVFLTGPPGTPYSEGLWLLHLKVPDDYPNSPPKATFRTRIWHPNVEELSGAVCVDTLKRDWQAKLTLRDVLITISCLLIHPNPDSALNASAGTLLREDYATFAHQAKLMTSIHAVIPTNLGRAVKEAKHRGEDPSSGREGQDNTTINQRPRNQQRPQKGNTRKPTRNPTTPEPNLHHHPSPTPQPAPHETMLDSENDDASNSGKENDPSLSPTPVRQLPPTPRRNALGKRPLSVLTTSYPEDPDMDMMLVDSDSEHEATPSTTSPSEQNISANARDHSPVRKSPKLTLNKGGNASSRAREALQIYEDVPDRTANDSTRRFNGVGKENCGDAGGKGELHPELGLGASAGASVNDNVPVMGQQQQPTDTSTPQVPSSLPADASSKVYKKVASGVRKPPAKTPKTKPTPRIGIRRL